MKKLIMLSVVSALAFTSVYAESLNETHSKGASKQQKQKFQSLSLDDQKAIIIKRLDKKKNCVLAAEDKTALKACRNKKNGKAYSPSRPPSS